jgi:hypothetical protein
MTVPSSLFSFNKFPIHLLADTFLRVLAPLDAGGNVVPDDKTAVVAGHLEIIGEDLDLISALGAFFLLIV